MDKDLSEKIRENRESIGRDVSPKTITTYINNLRALSKIMNDGKETGGVGWLLDPDKVIKTLEDNKLSYTTVRNYLNSVIIYITIYEVDKEILTHYQRERDKMNDKYSESNASSKWSEKQGANVLSMVEVKKVLADIGRELKALKLKDKLKNNGVISQKDKYLLQIYTVLSIHVEIPMRNDLADTIVIKSKKLWDAIPDEDKVNNNYLVIYPKNCFFVMNEFKTSKKYGQNIIQVSEALRRTIRFHIHFLDNKYLLTRSDGEHISRNYLSQMLLKEFKKRTGKAISTTLLRKIFLTDKYGELKKQLAIDNKNMGHSKGVALDIYVKDGFTEEEDKNMKEDSV